MEKSHSHSEGMKQLVQKVLTDKSARNEASMRGYVAQIADVGIPWN